MSETIQSLKRKVIKQHKEKLRKFKARCINQNLSKKTLMLLVALDCFAVSEQRLMIEPESAAQHALRAMSIVDEVLLNKFDVIRSIEQEIALLNNDPIDNNKIILFTQPPDQSYAMLLKQLRIQLLLERPLIPALVSMQLLIDELEDEKIDKDSMGLIKQIKKLVEKTDRLSLGTSESVDYCIQIKRLFVKVKS